MATTIDSLQGEVVKAEAYLARSRQADTNADAGNLDLGRGKI
jgi:hypothetical protein